MKKVVQDLTSGGIDWQREKWQSGLGSKFIHQGEKNAAKYADEVIVLSKGVQDYFKETYGREAHFIPNGVNRPQTREASLITDKFGLKKDSYILFLGRLVPEKGIRYLVEAFKNVKTDKKLVIAGGSSDTDSFISCLAVDGTFSIRLRGYIFFSQAVDNDMGIESFKEWFKGNESQYAIIGGTACDILMTEEGLDFRATKDIDLVLIIEAVDAAFGRKFWDYVKQAGYEHCNKSSGMPQFYRFSHPMSNRYPAMIELFTRKLDAIQLPDDAVLTPLPMDEDISSLSAILLDDDYYEFLKQGKVTVDGVTVLDAAYLIPFKAKAWMDLTDRKEAGEHVDSKNIKKHKNDVFRLTELIDPTVKIATPSGVYEDMQKFVDRMKNETVDVKQLGLVGRTKEQILQEIGELYAIQ